jgi:putative oxidoreductase
MRELLFLESARRFGDCSLLLLRVVVGSFLIWGVWDNIISLERRQEFIGFLTKFGFPAPEWMAPLSVAAQFIVGVCFVVGLFTRWAGVLCMINFLVAIAMVDRFAGVRGAFASMCLVLIGLYLATYGAGRYSIDRHLTSRTDNR